MGHDFAKIKAPEELKVTISNLNWHILVDEALRFKRSKFFETRGGIIPYLCKLMFTEIKQGHPIQVLRQDNAGEKVKFVKTAKGMDWKLDFEPEFTARKTSQQNSHAETSFTVIVAQARLMMVAVQIPDDKRFKLWSEVVVTATFLNNLLPVTIGDVTQTGWEHARYQLPILAKNLCTFGEAGIIKEGKKGKVLDRGLTMMFVGYSESQAESVFKMYSPDTSRIVQTQDMIWMGGMFHTRRNADITQQLPIVTVPISIHDATNDAEIQKLEMAAFPVSEERGGKAILQRQHRSPLYQRQDMVTHLEERTVHTIQALEPL
jgi:hypothetical protein